MEFHLQDLIQIIVSGIAIGTIYALIALGYTIIYNSLRLINFAQGDMCMLGAVLALTFYVNMDLPFVISFILATLSVVIIGIIIERVIFKPLRKHSLLNLIIATIGLAITIRAIGLIVWGSQALKFPPVFGEQPIKIAGIIIMPHYLWVSLIGLIFILVLHLFFTRTVTGKAMRATAQNRDTAALMGINVRKMDTLAAAISAGLGAVGGILVAPIFFVETNMGSMLGLKGFTSAVLGGFGSIPGSILGGITLGLAENISAGYISSSYKNAVAFIILIIILLIRPTGILGKRKY